MHRHPDIQKAVYCGVNEQVRGGYKTSFSAKLELQEKTEQRTRDFRATRSGFISVETLDQMHRILKIQSMTKVFLTVAPLPTPKVVGTGT